MLFLHIEFLFCFSEACRYKKVLWKEVRVGDLIHLSNNEVIPADVLLLRSSDPSGICYIDTGHLDGETNLKQRQVARGFVEKVSIYRKLCKHLLWRNITVIHNHEAAKLTQKYFQFNK